MTFAELEENLKKLKIDDAYCSLLNKKYDSPAKIREPGLYVEKNTGSWEVYYTERGSAELVGVFCTENDLYEYVYCYFKKNADVHKWFGGLIWQYPQELIARIKKFRIPESEYSFEGEKTDNCLCVEKQADGWVVYYIDGLKKENHGVFRQRNEAYDYLFYLVMKKHVDIKKRWW